MNVLIQKYGEVNYAPFSQQPEASKKIEFNLFVAMATMSDDEVTSVIQQIRTQSQTAHATYEGNSVSKLKRSSAYQGPVAHRRHGTIRNRLIAARKPHRRPRSMHAIRSPSEIFDRQSLPISIFAIRAVSS